MSKPQSSVQIIICRNCGTENRVPKSLAARYFEGNKPSVPMHMRSHQQRGQQPSKPLCRGCRKLLF